MVIRLPVLRMPPLYEVIWFLCIGTSEIVTLPSVELSLAFNVAVTLVFHVVVPLMVKTFTTKSVVPIYEFGILTKIGVLWLLTASPVSYRKP